MADTLTIVRNSRLRFADLVSVDDTVFWDVLDLPEVPVQQDDITYEVIGGDRIDNLANRFYGDPVLWWVIAVANDIELPPFGLHPGARIRVPSPTYVKERLFDRTRVKR